MNTENQIKARLAELHLAQTEESTTFPGTRSLRKLTHDEWQPIIKEQNELRSQLRTILLGKPDTIKIRTGYTVAGWSEKHEYFRNKYDTFETLEEAKACLETLKTKPNWGIPTIIIKMTWTLAKTFSPEKFETLAVNQLGSADHQELVEKNMMGAKKPTWATMLRTTSNNYTY